MDQSEKVGFGAFIKDVLAFYRQDVSEFTLSVWWEACRAFSMEQVRKALTMHAMDPERGRFPPMPADIVKVLHGTQTDRALLAWSKAHRAISEIGAYESADFGDHAIHSAIVDMGGWVKFCQSSIEELPFMQKRFCDLYRMYQQRPGNEHASRLVGVHEQTNAALGRAAAPQIGMSAEPLRIADVSRKLKAPQVSK